MYKVRLKNLREEQEMTQADMAKIIKIHEFVYGQYEREYVIMPIKHLNTLSNYFNVSIDYIFSFTDKKQYFSNSEGIDLNLSSKRLLETRKDNLLTQQKLADIIHVERSTIAQYERGKNIIATPFLYTICQKYKISADYLLGKIDNPKYLEIN